MKKLVILALLILAACGKTDDVASRALDESAKIDDWLQRSEQLCGEGYLAFTIKHLCVAYKPAESK